MNPNSSIAFDTPPTQTLPVGTFAEGLVHEPHPQHVGTFAEGCEHEPHPQHVGTFAEGLEQHRNGHHG